MIRFAFLFLYPFLKTKVIVFFEKKKNQQSDFHKIKYYYLN
jgi:hypothetical protein